MLLFWLMLTVLGIAQCIEVDFSGDWVPGIGAVMNCTWRFLDVDRLQSAKLYYMDTELAVYRPEIYGRVFRFVARSEDNSVFETNCFNEQPQPNIGGCIIRSVDRQPPKPDYFFTCEVSGERPRFRVVRKMASLQSFVASSGAKLEAREDRSRGSVNLNCTATGLPAPELQWTIGDRQIKGDFTGRLWNKSSKVWDVWSTVNLTPSAESALEVLCSPLQGSNDFAAPTASYTLKQLSGRATSFFKGVMLNIIILLTPLFALR